MIERQEEEDTKGKETGREIKRRRRKKRGRGNKGEAKRRREGKRKKKMRWRKCKKNVIGRCQQTMTASEEGKLRK